MRWVFVWFWVGALAASLSAAVTIGAERAVGTTGIAPAPFAQDAPSVASNGSEYVAVWLDPRASRSAALAQPKLYATRLNDRAQPVETFGHTIDGTILSPAKIASNGHGYVMAYIGANGVETRHLDDNGVPDLPPVGIGVDFENIAIGSNGSSYLIAHGNTLTIALTSGDPILRRVVAVSQSFVSRAVTNVGPTYYMAQSKSVCTGIGSNCTGEIDLYTLTDSGTLTAQTLATGVPQTGQIAIASGGGRVVVAYESDDATIGRAVDTWLIDSSNNSVLQHLQRVLPDRVDCLCGTFTPAVGYDGIDFLVAWQQGQELGTASDIYAVRMRPDGTVRDVNPFIIASFSASTPQIAANHGGVALVWRDASRGTQDIVSRQVVSFGDLIPSPLVSILVSATMPLQTQLQVATLSNGALAVWREREVHASIEASTPTCRTTIAPFAAREVSAPSVASATDFALIAWREEIDTGSFRIMARRMGKDCTLLDFSPMVLANETRAFTSDFDTTAVAFNGSTFLVVWTAAGNTVHGARVDAAGKALDSQPINVSVHDVPPFFGLPESPRVVWDGTTWTVAWAAGPGCPGCAFPPPVAGNPTNLYAAQVNKDGVVVTRASQTIVNNAGVSGQRIGLASGGGHTVLVWLGDSTCVNAAFLNGGNTVNAFPLHCFNSALQAGDIDLTYTNGAFVATWTEPATVNSSTVMAAFDGNGRLITDVMTVSPAGIPAFGVAIAPTLTGVTVGYSRFDSDSGNVARAFVRPADGIAATPARHRTVRH